jgi:hypothetical protein
MKIINPIDTEHELILIPRYYVSGDVSLELTNEFTKEVNTYALTPITIDGYMYLNFTDTFDNNSKFQIKVTDNQNVLFRGILFVIDQSEDTQNYKTSKGVFTYE